MTVDILSQLKRTFDRDAIDSLSASLSDQPDRVAKALALGGPSVLAGLLHAATGAHANRLMDALRREPDEPGVIDGVRELVDAGSLGSVVQRGQALLRSIFGDKLSLIQDLVGGESGAKTATASTVLGLLAPTITQMIRDNLGPGGFNLDGLRRLLGDQTEAVARAAPAGLAPALGLHSLADLGAAPRASKIAGERPAVDRERHTPQVVYARDREPRPSAARWAVPLALGALALLAAYYLMPGEGPRKPMDEPVAIPRVERPAADLAQAPPTEAATPAATIEDRPVIETTARRIALELPGGETIEAPENSYVKEMVEVLRDGKPAVSQTFIAGDLAFDADGKLAAESNEPIDRLAKIAKAYPDVTLKVNGHESHKDAAPVVTREMAQSQADAVRSAIIAAGVPAERVGTEVVAPNLPTEHPAAVAENDVPISISIVAE